MLFLYQIELKRCDQKKGAPKPSLSHKVRPKRAWIDTPKLPQVTIFTIITHAMRRPLVARGVGDLGPAKAESPTLFCFPNLFRYFLTYYVRSEERRVGKECRSRW